MAVETTEVIENKQEEVAKPSLTDIVTDANKEHSGEKEDVTPPPAADEKKEEKKEEPKTNKYDLTDAEEEQARQLFAALKSPEHAPTVLEFIAKQAGYAKVETRQEAKEVKKDITAVLKESLGPDLDYLAEKLGPAISKMVDEKLEENTKDIRATLDKREEEKLQQEGAATCEKIAKEFFKADKIPDDIYNEVVKVMDRMTPKLADGSVMTVTEFLEQAFYSVVGRRGLVPVDEKKQERQQKSRNDVPSRLTSGGAKQPANGAEVVKFTNLTAAIEAAIDKTRQEQEK